MKTSHLFLCAALFPIEAGFVRFGAGILMMAYYFPLLGFMGLLLAYICKRALTTR